MSSPEHLKHNTQYGSVVYKEMWSGGGKVSSPHPKDRETLPRYHPILHPTLQVRRWNILALHSSSSADAPPIGSWVSLSFLLLFKIINPFSPLPNKGT